MQTVTTPAESGKLDASSLEWSVRRELTRAALFGATHAREGCVSGTMIESDKRRRARVIRDLLSAGWIVPFAKGEDGYAVPDAAAVALAVEPSGAPVAATDPRTDAPLPYAVVDVGWSGDQMQGQMLWRLQHPERYRWALGVRLGWGRDEGHWPIPLDGDRPLREQIAEVRAAMHPVVLDLCVSDDALVLAHQQHRARALWEQHRGRTKLALARFGGYSAKGDEADEEEVHDLPPEGRVVFGLAARDYDPSRSWEDDAQRQLREADEAIARAQERRAALLKRYTTVAIANPGPRPYDAMREKYETWIAEYIIRETGVDPRTLPPSRR